MTSLYKYDRVLLQGGSQKQDLAGTVSHVSKATQNLEECAWIAFCGKPSIIYTSEVTLLISRRKCSSKRKRKNHAV